MCAIRTAPIQDIANQKKPHHMKTWTLHANNFILPNQDFTHDLVTQSVKLRLVEIMTHLMPVKLPMDSNVPVKLPLNAAPGSNFSMSQSSLSPRFHHCCRDLRTGPWETHRCSKRENDLCHRTSTCRLSVQCTNCACWCGREPHFPSWQAHLCAPPRVLVQHNVVWFHHCCRDLRPGPCGETGNSACWCGREPHCPSWQAHLCTPTTSAVHHDKHICVLHHECWYNTMLYGSTTAVKIWR